MFERGNTYKNTDPTGHYWENLLDIGFIGLSIRDIINDPGSPENWAALGLDLATTALPFAAGGSLLVKGPDRLNDAKRVFNSADNANKARN